jgi:uncharacterized protein YqgC (DUF456 family)
MAIIGQIVFWCFIAIGMLILPFNLPGTFLMAGAAFVYALFTHFETFTPTFLLALTGLAAVAELIEYIIGTFITVKYGASKWGVLGAIGGGILGAIWGTPIMPVLGTVVGGFLGAYLGAYFLEYLHLKRTDKAVQAGYGAFVGKIVGTLSKLVIAIIMIVIMIQRM